MFAHKATRLQVEVGVGHKAVDIRPYTQETEQAREENQVKIGITLFGRIEPSECTVNEKEERFIIAILAQSVGKRLGKVECYRGFYHVALDCRVKRRGQCFRYTGERLCRAPGCREGNHRQWLEENVAHTRFLAMRHRQQERLAPLLQSINIGNHQRIVVFYGAKYYSIIFFNH